jgi:hypothetical protein
MAHPADHHLHMADQAHRHQAALVTFSAFHSVTQAATVTATDVISQCPGGSGILPASVITRDMDSVSTVWEETVEEAAEDMAVPPDPPDMDDKFEAAQAAADTKCIELLTCSSHSSDRRSARPEMRFIALQGLITILFCYLDRGWPTSHTAITFSNPA